MKIVSSVSVNVLFAGRRDGNVDSFCTPKVTNILGKAKSSVAPATRAGSGRSGRGGEGSW